MPLAVPGSANPSIVRLPGGKGREAGADTDAPRRQTAKADAFRLLAERDPLGWRYVLLLRFGVVNLVGVALVAAAWGQGLLVQLWQVDRTGLCIAIAAVFLVGMVWCGRRVWQISAELNAVRHPVPRHGRAGAYLQAIAGLDGAGRAQMAAALKLKLAARIAPVRHIASSLVVLGLIGTVLGFIIALSGVDPSSASDVGAIGPMVSTLIEGMSVALYTTLLGAILNVWLMIGYRLLEGGTVRLWTALVERGEQHGRA